MVRVKAKVRVRIRIRISVRIMVIREPKREGVGPSTVFCVTSILTPFHKVPLLMVSHHLMAP